MTPIYVGAMGPRLLGLAGELADGALAAPPPAGALLHRAPAHRGRDGAPRGRAGPLDLAACVWVSVAEDGTAARRALAEKVAYYGQALGDLIHARLGVTREAFAPITRAAMAERDLPRAAAMVTDAMLAIGIAGRPRPWSIGSCPWSAPECGTSRSARRSGPTLCAPSSSWGATSCPAWHESGARSRPAPWRGGRQRVVSRDRCVPSGRAGTGARPGQAGRRTGGAGLPRRYLPTALVMDASPPSRPGIRWVAGGG